MNRRKLHPHKRQGASGSVQNPPHAPSAGLEAQDGSKPQQEPSTWGCPKEAPTELQEDKRFTMFEHGCPYGREVPCPDCPEIIQENQ